MLIYVFEFNLCQYAYVEGSLCKTSMFTRISDLVIKKWQGIDGGNVRVYIDLA
jgi:hypothetical protein